MRYKCLVLDHDDTVVNSTATIHFPSFLAYLARVRPGAQYTLEEYFRKNFDPGVVSLFTDELGFSPEEMAEEFAFWQKFVKTRVPDLALGQREHPARLPRKQPSRAGRGLRRGASVRAAQAERMADARPSAPLRPAAGGGSDDRRPEAGL